MKLIIRPCLLNAIFAAKKYLGIFGPLWCWEFVNKTVLSLKEKLHGPVMSTVCIWGTKNYKASCAPAK